MLAVAIGVDVGVSFSVFGCVAAAVVAGGGVMLDDEVIPIGDPEVAIGADLGGDGGEPFVGGGDDGEGVFGGEARAILGDVELSKKVSGGAGDEGHFPAP